MNNKLVGQLPGIQGAYCAMITPFGADGRLNADMARAMVEYYVEKGLDGVFAVSNVGEFAAMPLEERRELIKICCETAAGRLRVCPGVTDFSYANMLALAEHAQRCGAAAVVLSAPVYYPYSAKYVEAFISSFLDESPLPVIFYHSPKFAQPVSYPFLLELMRHPRVAAVKESSGDAVFLQTLLEDCAARGITTPVMLGFEELALTGLLHGAKGSITSCGGIVPELMRAMLESFHSGDIQKAVEQQKSVCRVTMEIKRYGFPLGYKMAMKARGFNFRIVLTGLETLEAEYNAAVPELRKVLEREYALHGLRL